MLAFLTSLLVAAYSNAETVHVGSPKGTFSVSDLGAAQYSVSIDVPKGRGGMQPDLSIAYNSQSGNNIAGWGCGISGIPVITRGAKDIFHDGYAQGLSYSSNDALYYNGVRLILVSGQEGTAGAVYSPETDQFTTVTILPAVSLSDISFLVKSSDGMTYEFGKYNSQRKHFNENMAVIRDIWYINNATDACGNEINYRYTYDNYYCYPHTITYSDNTITFEYESRDDSQPFYMETTSAHLGKRLKAIVTKTGESVFRSYHLNYSNSGDAFSRLVSITEKNGVGESLRPISFQWNNLPSAIYTPLDTTINSNTSSCIDRDLYASDIDGDGKDDIIDVQIFSWQNNQIKVHLSSRNPDDVITIVDYFRNGTFGSHRYYSYVDERIDFDGDGLQDLVLPNIQQVESSYQLTYRYIYGKDLIEGSRRLKWITFMSQGGRMPLCKPSDFNNDGRSELLYIETVSTSNSYNCILKAVIDGDTIDTNGSLVFGNVPMSMQTADFNSDGLLDIIVFYDNGYQVFFNTGVEDGIFPFNSSNSVSGTTLVHAPRIYQGDFNGDGVVDFVYNTSRNRSYIFALGKNDGTFVQQTACDIDLYDQAIESDDDRFTFLITDYNNDGKSDVLIAKAMYGTFNVFLYNQYRLMLSNGTRLTEAHRYYTDDYEDEVKPTHILLGDFSGTGKMEILNSGAEIFPSTSNYALFSQVSELDFEEFVDNTIAEEFLATHGDMESEVQSESSDITSASTTESEEIHIYSNVGYSASSGKVTSITDGFQNTTTIAYSPLSDSGVYTKGTGSTYPMADCTLPIHVVSAATFPKGEEGLISMNYHYGGLKAHLAGKGLLGFSTIEAINNTLQSTTTTNLSGWNMDHFVPLNTRITTNQGINTSNESKMFALVEKEAGSRIYNIYQETDSITDIYQNTTASFYQYDTETGCLTKERTNYGSSDMYKEVSYSGFLDFDGIHLPTTVTLTQKHADDEPVSSITLYEYNTHRLPTLVTERVGTDKEISTSYTYDSYGNVTSKNVSDGSSPSLTEYYTYSSGKYLNGTSTSPSSISVNYELDTWGNILRKTEARGTTSLVTQYVYDNWGVMTSSVAPSGVATTYTLSGDSNGGSYYLLEETEGTPWVKKYFDSFGRNYMTESVGEGGTTTRQFTSYGAGGRIASIVNTDGSLAQIHSFSYDALGRKASETLPSGQTYSYSYEDRSVVTTDNSGRTYSKTFDLWGNIVTSEDPESNVSFTYTSLGNPSSATVAGATFLMEYDEAGNRVSLNDPDAGQTIYSYDAFGQLLSQTDSIGIESFYSYDVFGHLTSSTVNEETTTYSYGTTGPQYMRLTQVQGSTGTMAYTYDNYGRVLTVTRTLAGETPLTTTYTYNALDQLSSISYPNNVSVTYGYDNNGYKTSVQVNGTMVWQLGSNNGISRVSNLGSNLTRTVTRSPKGITNMLMKRGSTTLSELSFGYSQTSNNLISRSGMLSSAETFAYDNLDRLSAISVGGITTMQMAYANSGNITSKTGIGDYTYDSDLPHAVTAVDNSNNLIASDSHSTIFNAFNKIQEISGNGYQLDLVYGPDQQRWKSELRYTGQTILLSDDSEDCAVMGSVDETNAVGPVGPILNGTSRTILYDGNHERVTENNLTRDFYFLDEGVIYVKQNGLPDRILYACCDNLGSYLKLVDDNGTAYFNATYDAWGKQTITQNTIAFHRGYTGHEMLNEFDLINMNGRLYDPLIARFLSPDNYVQLEDFSQSYNRYSYCLNNPLKYTDPSGEFWDLVLFSAVYGAFQSGVISEMNGQNFWSGAWKGALIGGISSASGCYAGKVFSQWGGATNAFVGLASGAVSGLVRSAGNAWLNQEKFSQALQNGAIDTAISAVCGAIIGGQGSNSINTNSNNFLPDFPIDKTAIYLENVDVVYQDYHSYSLAALNIFNQIYHTNYSLTSGTALFAKAWCHYQVGGRKPMFVDASSLNFNNIHQSDISNNTLQTFKLNNINNTSLTIGRVCVSQVEGNYYYIYPDVYDFNIDNIFDRKLFFRNLGTGISMEIHNTGLNHVWGGDFDIFFVGYATILP